MMESLMPIKIKLKNGAYSEKELALLSMLSDERNKVSSKQLATKHFGRENILILNNVIASMRRLKEKMDENAEPYKLMKTKPRGPRPAEFWLERRRA
jgi:DNA-binding response OmpR family regulator